MFTGLIETTGRIESVAATGSGRRVRVATLLGADLRPGDSIAVNGVCLTVVESDRGGFGADVSPETVRVTTWSLAEEGDLVNLERPLRADARLGGHFVLGHVDGIGRVQELVADGDCHRLTVEIPAALLPYVVSKGSIAIDGVSLTVARLTGNSVEVQLVPFTVAHTAFGAARAGDAVNIEADVLGKYVARLAESVLAAGSAPVASTGGRA